MNNYPNKLETLKRQYKKIFIILYNFIEDHQNSKRDKSKIPFLDYYSELFVLLYFILFSYSILLLYFENFWNNNLIFLIIISIFVFIFIALLAIISLLLLFQEIRSYKNFPKILLKNTCQKGIQELEFCNKLSQFDKLALEYAENRIQLLIENRKVGEETINKLIPLLALGLTAFTVYQYKPENLDDFNFIKNMIVISGIMTIILKAITELIDNKTIYQKCLAIIQYAKILKENF